MSELAVWFRPQTANCGMPSVCPLHPCLANALPLCLCASVPLCLCSVPAGFQSVVRVVFHDRRLQYTEHQHLEGWRWNRPGDRILDIGELWAKELFLFLFLFFNFTFCTCGMELDWRIWGLVWMWQPHCWITMPHAFSLLKGFVSGMFLSRCPSLGGHSGASCTPSAAQHHWVRLGSCQERLRVHSGTVCVLFWSFCCDGLGHSCVAQHQENNHNSSEVKSWSQSITWILFLFALHT